MITGVLNWLLIPLILMVVGLVRNDVDRRHLLVLVPIAVLLVSSLIFAAGLKMKRLEGYYLAIAGSICAMLVTPGNIIGLPLGIWALVVLTHRDVREAFSARAGGEFIGAPPMTPPAPGSGALKVVGVILAAVFLFLSIPVGAILFAMLVPAYQRARQHTRAQHAAADANVAALNAAVSKGEDWQIPTSPGAWLAEENIDVSKVDTNIAPHVQVMIEDLQPDGNSHFRNIIREVAAGTDPLREIQFMNSDFVDVKHMIDSEGNILPFVAIHRDGRFHYSATLAQPVPVGSLVIWGADGIARNRVDETPGRGMFSYDHTHFPSASVPTRRVEVHRLPPGAELIEVSSNASSRVHDGRTEIVLDQIVPEGGGVGLSYRYRIAPKTTPAPVLK